MPNPLFLGSSCAHAPHDPAHLVFVIESNPANLDPRCASDAQSQRIGRLLFDGLVERDAQMILHPESFQTPSSAPSNSAKVPPTSKSVPFLLT